MLLKSFAGLILLAAACKAIDNPLTFWTLSEGDIKLGPGQVDIDDTQSQKIVTTIKDTVVNHNKFTLGVDLQLETVLETFGKLTPHLNMGYEHWTDTTHETSQTTESNISHNIKRSAKLERGDIYLVAIEMKMYVFKTNKGETKNIQLATGRAFSGVFSKDSFNNILLDDTFSSVAPRFNLNYYSMDALQNMVSNGGKVPTVELKFPAEGVYYEIVNTKYSNSRLGKWGAGDKYVGCGWWNDAEDQLWSFEKDLATNTYFIMNKAYPGTRLADYGGSTITYGNSKEDDQKWRITNIDGTNMVRITNAKTGGKFGMWADNACGFGNWPDSNDQIWELKPIAA